MLIVVLTVLATIFYTGFQIFSARAGGKIDGVLVAGVVNIFGFAIPLTVYLFLRYITKSEVLPTTKSGLVFAGLAGVSIAAFALAFQKLFQNGANLSVVSPIIFGAAVGLSVLYGAVFLNEPLSRLHVLGVLMVVAGIGAIIYARANG